MLFTAQFFFVIPRDIVWPDEEWEVLTSLGLEGSRGALSAPSASVAPEERTGDDGDGVCGGVPSLSLRV